MKTNAYPNPSGLLTGVPAHPWSPIGLAPRPGRAPGLWRVCGCRSPHCIYSAWSPLGHATANQTARHSCTYTGATAPPKSWTLWAGSILKFPSPFLLVGGSQFQLLPYRIHIYRKQPQQSTFLAAEMALARRGVVRGLCERKGVWRKDTKLSGLHATLQLRFWVPT